MKITMAILALILCLTGCGSLQTYETLSDVPVEMTQPTPKTVFLELPESSARPVMQSDSGDRLYLCDGYTISVQVFASGDLEKTLREITGHSTAQLQLIKTKQDALACYDCVWTAAGEEGLQTGRLHLLDDGNYHYAVSVMADAALSGQLQSQIGGIMRSICLMEPSELPNTGS